MSKKKSYYSRKWLNKSRGHAFIEVSSYEEDRGCEVTIGDCSRHITLDFFVSKRHSDTDSCLAGRLHKLDILIGELQKVRLLLTGPEADAN